MASRVADEKSAARRRWKWTLAGSPAGLGKLEAAAGDGHLAALLAIEVVSVERSVGATFYAGTYLADQAEAPPLLDRMIATGTTGELPRLHGLAVRPSEPDWLMPLFWKVNCEIEGEAWEREKQKLLGYLYTSLPECKVKVMCETDYLALNKCAEELQQDEDIDRDFHDEAMAIFRELIAPRLTEEVNTSVHFTPLRQAAYCVALGKWYREQIAEQGIHTRLMEMAAQMRDQLGEATEIGPGPDAPSWRNDCFNHYLQLLDGVFRVTLPETRGQSDGRRVRVYQSGCVRL